ENIEEQIDLRDYLRVILKQRWIIIAFFAIVVIVVAIYVLTATPIYKATTRLVIEKENPNVVSIQEVMAVDASGTDYYQTQYKIIESRTVAREVIKRLRLDQSEEFCPRPKDNFISNLKNTISDFKNSIISLLKTDKTSEEKETEEYGRDSGLVSAFISRIEVSPIRNSRLVDIGFEAKDPVLAFKIANTLASAYIDQNLEIKLVAAQGAMKWLNNRVYDERIKVEKAERALLQYKEENRIITDFSSDVEHVSAQKLAQLNTQVVEAQSRRVEAETRFKQAAALIGHSDMLDSVPEVLNNELIRQIKSMEVNLYQRMSEFSKKYGKNHPQMVAIDSELKTLQKRKSQEVNRVINSLKNEYKVALAGEESLKDALSKQKQELLDLNEKAIQYGVLRREVESAQNIYEMLIKRFKETSLSENMKAGNIRIIDKAEVPKTPVKPPKRLSIILAMIVGLFGGTGLAFFLEYLDNTIKTPDDLKQYLNIPDLGPVPLFAAENKGNPKGRTSDLIVLHSPRSTASESYRGIRTNILFSTAESVPQVILVSSAGPREGKTITAANVAITMAQAGSKIIILDCDMRRPEIHNLFGATRDRGMSNILVGVDNIGEIIQSTKIPDLDVITSGPIPPNPSEMLGSKRMESLIVALRKKYDHILIDSPPVTAVTDAVVLSKSADGVIMVIRTGDMARQIVKNGIGQFNNVGAHIIGAVLNGIDLSSSKYSYYYYQYYRYYYGEDGEKKKPIGKKRKKRSKTRYGEEA
ncbi:MAG: GumC family protein, partial [Desulfobacterales bacterium]